MNPSSEPAATAESSSDQKPEPAAGAAAAAKVGDGESAKAKKLNPKAKEFKFNPAASNFTFKTPAAAAAAPPVVAAVPRPAVGVPFMVPPGYAMNPQQMAAVSSGQMGAYNQQAGAAAGAPMMSVNQPMHVLTPQQQNALMQAQYAAAMGMMAPPPGAVAGTTPQFGIGGAMGMPLPGQHQQMHQQQQRQQFPHHQQQRGGGPPMQQQHQQQLGKK